MTESAAEKVPLTPEESPPAARPPACAVPLTTLAYGEWFVPVSVLRFGGTIDEAAGKVRDPVDGQRFMKVEARRPDDGHLAHNVIDWRTGNGRLMKADALVVRTDPEYSMSLEEFRAKTQRCTFGQLEVGATVIVEGGNGAVCEKTWCGYQGSSHEVGPDGLHNARDAEGNWLRIDDEVVVSRCETPAAG